MRIIPLHVGQTALSGTADTDTTVGGADYDIPTWAKSILGMSISDVPDLPTAAQTVVTRANITSNNIPIQPFHALASPVGGVLGASGGGQFAARKELYDVNLRCNGGERLTCAMRPLATSTSAHYGSIELLVSDAVPVEPQHHIQAGTWTTDTVINAENPGTQYSISGARDIVQLLGLTGPSTIATSEGYIGRIRYSSSEFDGLNNADLVLNPVAGGLGTLQIAFIDGVSRRKCNIPIQQGVSQCNIIDNFRMISSADIAAAVGWVSAVDFTV